MPQSWVTSCACICHVVRRICFLISLSKHVWQGVARKHIVALGNVARQMMALGHHPPSSFHLFNCTFDNFSIPSSRLSVVFHSYSSFAQFYAFCTLIFILSCVIRSRVARPCLVTYIFFFIHASHLSFFVTVPSQLSALSSLMSVSSPFYFHQFSGNNFISFLSNF